MNIHEYQAKEVLRKYKLPLLGGGVASTPAEAVKVAQRLGGGVWVVKAQIHAGGRGKGGGVKLGKSLDDVKTHAADIIGMNLITPQTGPEGRHVRLVYVEAGCSIARELYFSMLLDRPHGKVSVVCSTEGGMNIEEVAHETPEKIHKIVIEPSTGITSFHIRRMAKALKLEGVTAKEFGELLKNSYKAFLAEDASLLEINPLVVDKDGHLVVLDAKMAFDDNALYRHEDIRALRDFEEEDPSEVEASRYELNYVKLDGNIGCMVNGAGLAMATMDIIQLSGGEPANFLDVGGGAGTEQVTAAFKIILSDPNVKGVLVNIFGGIMKCDVIAEGILAAAKEVNLRVPLVVRLEGTNVDKGKAMLQSSSLKIITADDLGEAARKIVAAVKGA